MPCDKRLTTFMEEPLSEIFRQERNGVVITVFDKKGVVRRTFDFSDLGFSHSLAEAAARFFSVRYGHLRIETQSLAWRAYRNLASAVAGVAGCEIQRLPINAIPLLREELLRLRIAPRGAQCRINTCVDLVEWCLRNEPNVVYKHTSTLVPTMYQRVQPVARPEVPEDVVKRVLAACYTEIEEVERLHELGRRLWEEGVQPSDNAQVRAFHQLLVATRGKIPLQKGLESRIKKVATQAGGLRLVTEHLRVTASQVFLFYLAILAQTGANPMALRELRRDCVLPHPLVSNLERIVWEKRRSGKEQYVDFPLPKEWSAPNLVRRLVALNAVSVPAADKSDQQYLFLFQNAVTSKAALASWANIHILLDKFIKKHGLPNFDLAGFRTNVAKAHHIQAGSIVEAKNRLNHADVSTTARYTPLTDRAVHHDQTMIQFQGRFVREARGEQSRWLNDNNKKKKGMSYETLFGFHCSDPFEGRMPGSTVGKLCLQFQQCATCPGALIPLDDVRVVAKLLATSRHLELTGDRAKKEGWWDRYRVVYEPIRLILLKELLPGVSDSVLTKAEKLVTLQFLPHLE